MPSANEPDARALLHALLELPSDELAAFTRYLEALQAQGQSHHVEVSDPAGMSDEVREEQIATGTGHAIARVTGMGTGYAVHAAPAEPTTTASLWEDIRRGTRNRPPPTCRRSCRYCGCLCSS